MKRVVIRVTEKGSGNPVPVKLHVHGTAGEYLAPVDRAPDSQRGVVRGLQRGFRPSRCLRGGRGGSEHWCTYIPGETTLDVPLGTIFVEVARGFEIRPVRKRFTVDGSTDRIDIELDRVLPWRRRGWVTADTHVHFLSPVSALLEGSAEGINVVQPAGQPVGRAHDECR